MTSKVTRPALTAAGGALGGYLEGKGAAGDNPNQTGVHLGALVGLGALAYGFVGSGKVASSALSFGAGAWAFKMGQLVANKVSGTGR